MNHSKILAVAGAMLAVGVVSGCSTPRSGDHDSALNETHKGIGCALAGGGVGAVAGQAVSSAAGGVVGAGAGAVVASMLCDGSLRNLSLGAIDTDGDGHADDTDECPGTPAGVGVQPSGCPIDSDDDGVPDYIDDCPGTPVNVRVDVRGCGGAHDSDGDGVADATDRCPNTPAGARVDENGCSEVGEALLILEDIKFDFDRHTIRADAARQLEGAARTLQANPQLQVRIEGHTDNVGVAAYNMQLSERRAREAMNYLTQLGIAKERLTTIGKGEESPVADNNTEAGREQNRRVAFIVTAK